MKHLLLLLLLAGAALMLSFTAGTTLADPPSLGVPPSASTPATAPSASAPAAAGSAASTAAVPTPQPAVQLPANTCGPALPGDPSSTAAAAAATAPATATPPAAPASPDTGTATTPGATPSAQATPPAPLKVQGVAKMSCAGGMLLVDVSARPYEYHVGDNIVVNVVIGVADGAKIDLNPLLKQGRLYLVGSGPFELADRPVMTQKVIKGGVQYNLTLLVRQFAPGPYSTFTMQIPYATSFTPSGQALWEPLQTPDFIIMQDVNGQTGMSQPTLGNTGLSQPRQSWAMAPATILMVVLLLLWPAVALMRFVNRVRPRRQMPRQAAAWLALNRVQASGKEIGYSANHYARISQVIRQYLAPTYPGIQSMPASAIAGAFPADAILKLTISALAKIERVLVDRQTLSAAEHRECMAEVDQIIPRPLSM
ncbi:MAG: hypothetical protein KGS72_12455 [Cyanobacteria bacterium REEB67]|nr:hypothetical protein [Cyanobacteria bacterium REEB67]